MDMHKKIWNGLFFYVLTQIVIISTTSCSELDKGLASDHMQVVQFLLMTPYSCLHHA
jgi:hypothetical protein